MTITYRQYAAATHERGGETQTEATAKMRSLGKQSSAFLRAILDDLHREGAMATTMEQYRPIRTQIERVRVVLLHRGDL